MNKNIKYIELPEEVKQQNKEYLEENNNILTFINYLSRLSLKGSAEMLGFQGVFFKPRTSGSI